MTSVASRRLVDVVDVGRSSRAVAGLQQRLRTCTVEPWGLHTVRVDPDDPFVVLERTWLLPDAGLRVRRCWAPGEDGCPSTTVGAVRVEVEDRRWFTTDLVLGLEVRRGRSARVAHAAEFAAALQGALLSPSDADDAMATVHRAQGEIVAERHDLHRWAASHGVTLA